MANRWADEACPPYELIGDDGARGIVKMNAARVVVVPLAAAGFDIDRPADLLKMPRT